MQDREVVLGLGAQLLCVVGTFHTRPRSQVELLLRREICLLGENPPCNSLLFTCGRHLESPSISTSGSCTLERVGKQCDAQLVCPKR